jgi:flavin reductase (DIM6/NTAB) family NADH-FMN oxidoreductase RutF
MDFMFSEIDPKIRYKLLSATVTPRPIAWVSTLDEAGRTNAAPFSFFNAFGEDRRSLVFPPCIGRVTIRRTRAATSRDRENSSLTS